MRSDKWIWLPKTLYPHNQKTRFDALSDASDDSYIVAEFQKEYVFDKKIKHIHLRFSGDTEFQLYCNDRIIATGPAAVGGDFLGNGSPREWFYASETDLDLNGDTIRFFARVKMMPVRICEYSKGHGGFMLNGKILFEDGSCESISTDNEWLVRRNGSYLNPLCYDETIGSDEYVQAEEIDDIWHAETAPIPIRTEEKKIVGEVTLEPFEERTVMFSLDMIYAGFSYLQAMTEGVVSVELVYRELETDKKYREESVTLTRNGEYRGFYLHSTGCMSVKFKNDSDTLSHVTVGFIATHYPIAEECSTVTSDEVLNKLLRVCKHTLKYCRQTHHLDSPRHCEPLACTGDYYIESLMTAFSFGDQRLSEFDVVRTAKLLRHNQGRMFHTTYSLIWVRMLYDVYMMGGNIQMLQKCEDALDMLLERFHTYLGENGLIENPPDYMFVDWIYIDGLSMHHPPKCLGQTVLNMFYFMALCYADRIYTLLEKLKKAKRCEENAEKIKKAINEHLYDKEKNLYFEGLSTPSQEETIYQFHPQNVDKRYYLKHSNIMAAYTSVCDDDTAKMLIEKIMTDEIEGDVQPYFIHYLLEAIYMHGLREKYTLQVIERWKNSIEVCSKGLAEGFVTPEPAYSFDHSHAWGGTPLWSLPKALLGLSIEEPAYRKVRLSPSLLGLECATVKLPTPYGTVICEMEQNCDVKIVAPKDVTVEIVGE